MSPACWRLDHLACDDCDCICHLDNTLDSSPAAPPLPRADAPSLPAAGEAPTTTTQEALL